MTEFRPITDLDPSFGERMQDYAKPELIGVSTDRLGRLAWLGGFQRDVTLTAYDGKVTENHVTAVGATSEGALVGGSVHEVEAPLGRTEFEMRPFDLVHSRPPLTIGVNISEIEGRIGRTRASMRDPKVWSDMLNASITSQARQAAWDHYVHHPQWGELGSWTLGRLFGAAAFGTHDAFSYVASVIFGIPERAFIAKMFYGRDIKDSCWSLLPGIHIDRALLVSGVSRALPVVRPLK